jgi:hypothetical protein
MLNFVLLFFVQMFFDRKTRNPESFLPLKIFVKTPIEVSKSNNPRLLQIGAHSIKLFGWLIYTMKDNILTHVVDHSLEFWSKVEKQKVEFC